MGRYFSLAVLALVVLLTPAAAQVRVPITATVLTPGATLGGRTVVDTGADPGCLVTAGSGLRTDVPMLVRNTRVGEHWAAITPAFGRCDRAQNPYRVRLVVFDRVDVAPGAVHLARGSLRCALQAAGAGDVLVCNRPLRCDLAKARCDRP